jgi:hypothetical protein
MKLKYTIEGPGKRSHFLGFFECRNCSVRSKAMWYILRRTVEGGWRATLVEAHHHDHIETTSAKWTAVRDSMSQAMAAAQADYNKRFAS